MFNKLKSFGKKRIQKGSTKFTIAQFYAYLQDTKRTKEARSKKKAFRRLNKLENNPVFRPMQAYIAYRKYSEIKNPAKKQLFLMKYKKNAKQLAKLKGSK